MKEIYADLTQDLVFKKAFASEQDKELLISLLNAFLERKLKHPITDVTVKNPYIQGETLKNRDSIVDIRCKDAEGNNFNPLHLRFRIQRQQKGRGLQF
jgi:predicted transposase/invertase (TIGR01784 family)